MNAETRSEVITQDRTQVSANEAHAVMAVIERIAANPDADIAKLEKMLDMQERILDRNAKQAFSADLASMQMALPRVIEHGTGHNQAKFAKLEDINDTIRPVLHQYGFAITFRTRCEPGLVVITTVLSHQQGHSEETEIPLPADTSGGKNAVQAIGSTISYGKRYGICALLNISTGDDTDGGKPSQLTQKAADWIAYVEECADMPTLQKRYQEAFKDLQASKDKFGAEQLNKAKDAKKRELSK